MRSSVEQTRGDDRVEGGEAYGHVGGPPCLWQAHWRATQWTFLPHNFFVNKTMT